MELAARFKDFIIHMEEEIAAIDEAVAQLGFALAGDDLVQQDPAKDARFEALIATIENLLRDGNSWKRDERLVVFTEYKTTLDYLVRLVRRLRERYEDDRLLLDQFEATFRNGPYKHRSPTLGNQWCFAICPRTDAGWLVLSAARRPLRASVCFARCS